MIGKGIRREGAAIGAFRDFIQAKGFPCVGAKSALALNEMRIVVAGDLRSSNNDVQILQALQAMRPDTRSPHLAAVTILFPETTLLSEPMFEIHLWDRLQALHDVDRRDFAWSKHVDSDTKSLKFGMSIGGMAFYVVGLHPGASRMARRAPMAALAFNPHEQFSRLRNEGRFDRLRRVVRKRDVALQGDANPMLADHGTASEASQYSGRAVSSDWICPFLARHDA